MPKDLHIEDAVLQEQLVDKFLPQQVIEPCPGSPWNAEPVVIYKPDGTLRPAINYRGLNASAEKDTFPLPNIEENLAKLGRADWFTTLDLLQGFLQVELTDESKPKTAFTVKGRQYQLRRMPMGLTSSHGAFMRVVDAVLRGLPPDIAFAYV